MKETPPNPWIHIGDCPVCVQGLVRIRTCTGGNAGVQHFAMCDECEAIWLEPDTSTEKQFPDAENAKCPICEEDLFGSASRWSLPADISGTDWEANSILEFTSPELEDTQEFVADEKDDDVSPADITKEDRRSNPGC
ncbi:MAG: hypothetical protein AB8B50_13150 [Pirellulaceae bacterium]